MVRACFATFHPLVSTPKPTVVVLRRSDRTSTQNIYECGKSRNSRREEGNLCRWSQKTRKIDFLRSAAKAEEETEMEPSNLKDSELPLIGQEIEPSGETDDLIASEQSGGGLNKRIAVGTVVAASLIGGLLYFGHPGEWLKSLNDLVQHASDMAESAGPLAPLYYGCLYILCTVLLLPASVLTIGAGYVFGALKGTAVVSVASTLGASLSFLIARYVARPIVSKQLEKYNKFTLVDKAIAEDGWKIVFLWRLSPLFPFGASNYMFGLTGVNFWAYVASSWAAMLPATFTYVYLGSVGRATVDVISGDAEAQVQPLKVVLYVVGAIATLLVTREISSKASKALKEAEDSSM